LSPKLLPELYICNSTIQLKMRKVVIISVVAIIIILIGFRVISGKKEQNFGEEKEKKGLKYIKVEAVKNFNVPLHIESSGRVTSSRNINLSTEVQGQLQRGQITLKSGSRFRKGQLLFKVDNEQALYALAARKSSFINLVAVSLPDIKRDHPKSFESWSTFYKGILRTDKNLPKLPLFTTIAEKTFTASRNILTEYYSIKAEEARLKKYLVFAPFSGTIENVMTEIGTVVSPGMQVATIVKNGDVEINIPVKIDDASLIVINDEVELANVKGRKLGMGRVTRIGSVVDPTTQSIPVYAQIKGGKSQQIFAGMYFSAKIKTGTINNAYELPRRALVNEGELLQVKDSMVVPVFAKIERKTSDKIIVTGLENGTLLVVEPLTNINTKDSIKVAPLFN